MSVRDTDKGMLELTKALAKLKNTEIKVGVFSDAVNTEGKNTEYVADYAIANEYGYGHIPERSFIRSTIDEQQDAWSKLMGDVLTNTTKTGGANLERDLYKVGAVARSDIIAKINSNISPQNAPATIKRKGNKNRTLIEHGVLRNSIEARIGGK